MNTLVPGMWVSFQYNNKVRRGRIEERMYVSGRFQEPPYHDGYLMVTEDGYRHFKIRKMHDVKVEK